MPVGLFSRVGRGAMPWPVDFLCGGGRIVVVPRLLDIAAGIVLLLTCTYMLLVGTGAIRVSKDAQANARFLKKRGRFFILGGLCGMILSLLLLIF